VRATRNGQQPEAVGGVDSWELDGLSEPLLNAAEAAELLHVPRSTLYELVRSRHLPHVRVGRGLRFTRADLSQWVADNTFR
jgi:excisionase family DNA binding protein